MPQLIALGSLCAANRQFDASAGAMKFRRFARLRPAVMALAALLLPAVASAGFTGLERVATGLSAPMFVTHAPGDPNRLFIALRGTPNGSSSASATIRILNLNTGLLEPDPFLTIPGVNNNGEGGLLGLAFHPDYQTNHKFYAYVTANDSISGTPFSSYIREYSAPSATSNVANPAFTPVLNWSQPQDNHNGGFIGFSPQDGYLYVMSGDGGNGNDQGTGHTEPGGNAQDLTSNFLGKVLRVDVNGDDFPADTAKNYSIPPTNPFVDDAGDDEIWASGLRNPFRSGFDRATGDLWIGDVGQGRREEIDFQSAASPGGENYGWRLREGLIQTPGSVGGPKPADVVDPVWDYKQSDSPDLTPADTNFTGQAVVGGVPYRGPDPTLQGLYFFADTITNRIWTLRLPTESTPVDVDYVSPQLPFNVGSPSSPVAVGEDAKGNLYIAYLSGSVYRIKTDTLTPGDFNADALVSADDLALWTAGFGMESGAEPKDGDADSDGDVDGDDFLAWQRNLGYSALNVDGSADAANVPEPAAAALLVVAALTVNLARRHRPQS